MKCDSGYRAVTLGSAALAIAAALSVGAMRLEAAALLPAEQNRLNAVDTSLHKAADLYRNHKLVELGKLVDTIQIAIAELKSGEDHQKLQPQIEQLELRLASAEKLLKYGLESASTDEKPAGNKKLANKAARKPMKKPVAMARANPAMTNPMAKQMAMAGRKPTGAGGISFAAQIAPLLSNKCGRCHTGNAPKGGFSVATYADIRKGSDSGVVFFPGKGQGSRLIELVETGEMPKGGGKLSNDEIALLTQWIDLGAPFDADPAMGAGGGSIAMATGKESVSFMRDVAPVLVANCTNCHGGERGADNMELDTFTRLMRGGRDGAIILPGNPTGSLIVQMVEGTARDKVGPRRRMPDRRPPLKAELIEKIKTWIAEGAKFDGDDPNLTLEFQLRVALARKSTHEELSKMRDEMAKNNWNTGNPGLSPVVIEEDAFRLIGDLSPVRMQELAEQVKGIQTKVASALRVTSKPMYKGRLTIYVFAKRFEYSEFCQMVEKRELPADTSGHFRYTVVDGYMCVLNNHEADPNLPLLLAEGLAGSYIETLGKNLPRWFTIGAARAMAAKMEQRAPLVKAWDQMVITGGGSIGGVDKFLKAKELDTAGSAVAYELGKTMAPRLQAAVDAMRKGANFQEAFMRAYGGQPQAVAAAWLK